MSDSTSGTLSVRECFVILMKNQMEERVLKNKIGSIELQEKRLLRRFRSETRLLKIKQEQRLGNLSLKRQHSNGTYINKTSLSPQPEGKEWSTPDKRHSSRSVYVCEFESDNTSFTADEKCAELTERLPRLSSGGNEKAQEPMSPASTDTCQSPVNRKVTWILTSPDSKQSLLREECKNNCTKGIISETSMPFITEMPTRKSSGGRMRSKTWNGKALPRLQYERFSPRMRSFSEEDRRLRKQSDLSERTSNNAHGHISHKKCKDVFQDGSKIAGTKPREISRMSFPTAEDVQCRKFLSPPNFSIRKSSSMNSLKSRDSLPPVIEEQSYSSVFMNSEAVPGEGAAGTCQLPSSGKNSEAYQNPACHSRPGWRVQRRLRPLSRQGGVLEDASNNNASSFPSDSPTESPRGHESGASAARKASTKCKTSLTVNGIEQSQEPKTHKDTSITSERLTARSSSLSSQTTKRRESLRSKEKRSSLGTPEEDLLPEAVKVKWLKALKKVFNVNLFLNGMVALQTQREMDRVALEQKQAALENLYEELKHCRYLRLPSQEDESGHDCVSWAV